MKILGKSGQSSTGHTIKLYGEGGRTDRRLGLKDAMAGSSI